MAIALDCRCGKRLQVSDELRGKRVRCPFCREVLAVPASQLTGQAVTADGSDSVGSDGGYNLQELAALERTAAVEWELACPECDNRLRVSSSQAGQAMRCPVCFSEVSVPEMRPAEAEAAATTEAAPLLHAWDHVSVRTDGHVSDKPLASGWETARQGLNLTYFGGVVFSFAVLAMMASIVAAALFALFLLMPILIFPFAAAVAVILKGVLYFADHLFHIVTGFFVFAAIATWFIWMTQGVALDFLVGGGLIVMFLASLVVLVGWIMCVAIPGESGVKLLAVASVLALVGCLACYAGAVIAGLSMVAPGKGWQGTSFDTFVIGTYALGVAAHYLFVFFLRGVPRFFNHQAMIQRVKGYLIYATTVAGAGLLCGFVLRSQDDGVSFWQVILIFVFLGLMIGGVVKFLRLVSGARDDIRPYFRT